MKKKFIPQFERTRVVQIGIENQDEFLHCSCGLFQRMGFPCRHIYKILERKPIPQDLILRYHVAYQYFYQNPRYADGNELFENARESQAKGPAITRTLLESIPIKETIPEKFLKTMPGFTPVISKNSIWHQQQQLHEVDIANIENNISQAENETDDEPWSLTQDFEYSQQALAKYAHVNARKPATNEKKHQSKSKNYNNLSHTTNAPNGRSTDEIGRHTGSFLGPLDGGLSH
jgi:SWIM zinc finger